MANCIRSCVRCHTASPETHDDCPVSMVATVTMVRQLAAWKKDIVVIVAPLQKLSEKHLAMRRMVSGGNMFFISDEKWRKEILAEKIKLPLFIRLGNDFKVP